MDTHNEDDDKSFPLDYLIGSEPVLNLLTNEVVSLVGHDALGTGKNDALAVSNSLIYNDPINFADETVGPLLVNPLESPDDGRIFIADLNNYATSVSSQHIAGTSIQYGGVGLTTDTIVNTNDLSDLFNLGQATNQLFDLADSAVSPRVTSLLSTRTVLSPSTRVTDVISNSSPSILGGIAVDEALSVFGTTIAPVSIPTLPVEEERESQLTIDTAKDVVEALFNEDTSDDDYALVKLRALRGAVGRLAKFSQEKFLELPQPSDSPVFKLSDDYGYECLLVEDQFIDVGRPGSRTYRMCEYLITYSGQEMAVDQIFEKIRGRRDSKNHEFEKNTPRALTEKTRAIRNTIKKLQKTDGLTGKVKSQVFERTVNKSIPTMKIFWLF